MSVREFYSGSGTDPDYETLATLGSGSFGSVVKVRRKADGKVLACKRIKLNDSNTLNLVKREILVLGALSGCRNVVQWSDDVSLNRLNLTIHLHMEYYTDGDLESAITKQRASNDRFSEDYVVGILADMSAALSDCHVRGIIHRDIKPANVLLTTRWVKRYESDTAFSGRRGDMVNRLETRAYLCDFGIGTFSAGALMSGGMKGSTLCGTLEYMAPESISVYNPIFGQKSDIFSLGCVAYELCQLRPAYASSSRLSVRPLPGQYSEVLRGLIADCMTLSPTQRIGTALLTSRVQKLQQQREEEDKTRRKNRGLIGAVVEDTADGLAYLTSAKGIQETAANLVGTSAGRQMLWQGFQKWMSSGK